MQRHDVALAEDAIERDLFDAVLDVVDGELHIGVADQDFAAERLEQLRRGHIDLPARIDREVDVNFLRASRNLHKIDALPTKGANVYDILNHDVLAITVAGVEGLKDRLNGVRVNDAADDDEAAGVEAANAGPANDEAANDGVANDGVANDQAAGGETTGGEATHGEATHGEAASGGDMA